LEYVVQHANWEDGLLIVDDVFDSGSSIKAVIETLKKKMRRNLPDDIRIATPWFKPKKNVTGIIPDYFIHETDQWLIFPHELDGLTREEIFANKPGIKTRFEKAGLI
jgi:hypoxanthine phosphoribosyltransferase